MSDHVLVDRLQFTLTVTFHYLFPILTMGLALFIAYFKTVAYRARETERGERYDATARFWAKIFAVNFAVGVVTGIPISGTSRLRRRSIRAQLWRRRRSQNRRADRELQRRRQQHEANDGELCQGRHADQAGGDQAL